MYSTEELTVLFDSNAKNPSYNAAVNFTENSLYVDVPSKSTTSRNVS